MKAKKEIDSWTDTGMERALIFLQKGLEIVGDNILLYFGMGYVYWTYINIGFKDKEECIIKAEYYANRLREYLQANSTIYPLFFNPGSTIDTIRPHNTQIFGGIYLPPNYNEDFRYYDFPKGESPIEKRN